MTCFCLMGSKLLESKQAPIAKVHLACGPSIGRFEEVNTAAKANVSCLIPNTFKWQGERLAVCVVGISSQRQANTTTSSGVFWFQGSTMKCKPICKRLSKCPVKGRSSLSVGQ